MAQHYFVAECDAVYLHVVTEILKCPWMYQNNRLKSKYWRQTMNEMSSSSSKRRVHLNPTVSEQWINFTQLGKHRLCWRGKRCQRWRGVHRLFSDASRTQSHYICPGFKKPERACSFSSCDICWHQTVVCVDATSHRNFMTSSGKRSQSAADTRVNAAEGEICC